jgi:hypothetical protein
MDRARAHDDKDTIVLTGNDLCGCLARVRNRFLGFLRGYYLMAKQSGLEERFVL